MERKTTLDLLKEYDYLVMTKEPMGELGATNRHPMTLEEAKEDAASMPPFADVVICKLQPVLRTKVRETQFEELNS